MEHEARRNAPRRRLTPAQRKRLRRRRRIKKTIDIIIVVLVLALVAGVLVWLFASDSPTSVGNGGKNSGNSPEQTEVGETVTISITEVGVAASMNHTAWLADGKVYVAGTAEYSQTSVDAWRDIMQISVSDSHIVAVDKYGRVLAAGRNTGGQCTAYGLENAAFAAAGAEFTVCVMRDGTLQLFGIVSPAMRESLATAENVQMVDIAPTHIVALHADGTVSAYGDNDDGECDVSGWTNVEWVSAGDGFTVALTKDGTILYTGSNGYCQRQCTGWKDIERIEAGRTFVVGVKKNGEVLAIGRNGKGQCELENWSNVIDIAAGYDHTVGVRSDGSFIAAGYNGDGQCDVYTPGEPQ